MKQSATASDQEAVAQIIFVDDVEFDAGSQTRFQNPR
jgi:hypothetical protein